MGFCRGTSGSFGVPSQKDVGSSWPDVKTLDGYALERWEVHQTISWTWLEFEYTALLQTILHYMVSSGTGQQPTKPSQDVLYLLQRSQLMTSIRWVLLTDMRIWSLKKNDNLLRSGSALQITSAGFQFLLHSPHAQLWDLLLEYLHMAEVSLHLLTGNWFKYLGPFYRNGAWTLWKSSASCSCCLLWNLVWWVMVPCCVKTHVTHFKSQEYSTENLSQTQQAMLVDLRDYGLVWQREAIIWPSIIWSRTFWTIILTAIITAVQSHPPCDNSDFLLPPSPDIDWNGCRPTSSRFHRTRNKLSHIRLYRLLSALWALRFFPYLQCKPRQPTPNRCVKSLCIAEISFPQSCCWLYHPWKRQESPR